MMWKSLQMPRSFQKVETGEDGRYAKFVVEALERGWGITLGNALRRTLLSSLQGAAIVSVKIEGVEKEFSTIPGVKEDVTDIILNLKSIRVKLLSDHDETLHLDVSGDGEVTAKSFMENPGVVVLTPDVHIATLNGNASLSMDVKISSGRGFVRADELKDPNAPIGVIATDANFNPVQKVAMHISDTRVGQKTDYNRLELEITTDGSIDPDFAATSWKEGLQKFSSNTFGVCVRNADADWIHNVMVEYYGAANPDCNPFDRVSMIGALGNNKGDQPRMEAYISCMVAVQFAPEITEEKMDRFLAFYEYLLGEGKYMRMGLEGIDYTIADDGTVTKVRDENGNAANLSVKYPCIPVTHWTSWGFEMAALPNVEYFDEYNDETKALNAEVCAIRNQNPVYPEVGPILIDDDAVTDASAFNITSNYWAIISGDKPVADMFAEMKAAAEAYYGPATEKVTEIAAEYGW